MPPRTPQSGDSKGKGKRKSNGKAKTGWKALNEAESSPGFVPNVDPKAQRMKELQTRLKSKVEHDSKSTLS